MAGGILYRVGRVGVLLRACEKASKQATALRCQAMQFRDRPDSLPGLPALQRSCTTVRIILDSSLRRHPMRERLVHEENIESPSRTGCRPDKT